MKGFLLDANLLLALAWPNHAQHSRAQVWFRREQANGWGTCLMTQLAFIRVSSNAAVPHHVSPLVAFHTLSEITALPYHEFWTEPALGYQHAAFAATMPETLTHNFVTDGYLATLAAVHEGKLATFDQQLARTFRDAVLI
jgi:toxin-antitoxin system PIN domain toxin